MGFALIGYGKKMQGVRATALRRTGIVMVQAMPKLIKALSYIGTVAMLLVGGGIFVHHIPWLHHHLAFLPSLFPDLLTGLAVGALLVGIVLLWERPAHKH